MLAIISSDSIVNHLRPDITLTTVRKYFPDNCPSCHHDKLVPMVSLPNGHQLLMILFRILYLVRHSKLILRACGVLLRAPITVVSLMVHIPSSLLISWLIMLILLVLWTVVPGIVFSLCTPIMNSLSSKLSNWLILTEPPKSACYHLSLMDMIVSGELNKFIVLYSQQTTRFQGPSVFKVLKIFYQTRC